MVRDDTCDPTGVARPFIGTSFSSRDRLTYMGTGSLGAKAGGLAAARTFLESRIAPSYEPAIHVDIPLMTVIATDYFHSFLQDNGLPRITASGLSDEQIATAFVDASLPAQLVDDLRVFIEHVRVPLAVRSSSRLEDGMHEPFAGVYATKMIPNNNDDPEHRLQSLMAAVKHVYASAFLKKARDYLEATGHTSDDEEMAVIIQEVVGACQNHRFYPHISGVARSFNFYPVEGTKPEDGIVSVTLGMGKAVVDGGRCVRFCPYYPAKPIQSFTPEDHLENSPRSFLAMDFSHSLQRADRADKAGLELVSLDLDTAERHGTLGAVGSVYSSDNDALYDGTSRAGTRLVTMAGVLKGRIFPLAGITAFLLKVGTAASSGPVEIEFAVKMSDSPGKPHEFAFLQIRPLVLGSELQEIEIEDVDRRNAVCISHKALGNGYVQHVADIVYVREENFDRSVTLRVAEEVGELNLVLRQQKRPYLLIGPGRWGSADPWLGIPVKWAQISGVRCIVETGFEDMQVDPSQGSHFFQNIMSFGIGYLTVEASANQDDYLNTAWLNAQPAEKETTHLRHIALERPLRIALNGRKNIGVVNLPSQ